MVWGEGVLIKDYPPEAFTIKCLDDSWAVLATEDGQSRFVYNRLYKMTKNPLLITVRFEAHLRSWMKEISDLLQESEQLRLETDDQGPQDEIEYWKSRAARLTLLVEQMMGMPCKLTLVTLRAAKCKLLKVLHKLSSQDSLFLFRFGTNLM